MNNSDGQQTFSAGSLGSDAAFDAVYDVGIRALSEQHWTPVAVAGRAARLLALAGAKRILDVGSGAGKFCIVGALCTAAEFVGVERRAGLVEVARRAASGLGASRATFVHAKVEAFSFSGFDGFYLYNPFYEHVSEKRLNIDGGVKRTPKAHRSVIRATAERLRSAAPRAFVVTFHGSGGVMPRSYRFLGDELAGNDRLEVWVKE
jgi:SAM-dependent methyltransferase